MNLTLDDFDYPLPADRIAQHPLSERAASRLLVMRGAHLEDRRFVELPDLLAAGDILVFNDSRVIHARLIGRKETGGAIEVLIERIIAPREALAHIRASKSPRAGMKLTLADAFTVEVLAREGELFRLRFPDDALSLIERFGQLPLPPYIDHPANAQDEERYQTVFARTPGSVAAPTAGLHFDAALLERLQERGILLARVTLHVGAGTFQPVRVRNIAAHTMHRERYHVPPETVMAIAQARARGGRVIAVGTTSLRTLESASDEAGQLRSGEDETALFIVPGYRFKLVDLLITNFHLPKSTLLMLVSAFGGMTETRAAYRHAIEAGYRFFSYGDAMLIHRHDRI
ncbi:MAG: tRNA preQ1(34) S-adenosylmethionine ribosyltransferase-isomerase QueA [Rhodocyclaceae bacterium]|nr:tRNA preQ1(34) S-adenosylmethionine ribosyltransferase-isomerase QueA [Rhodocyclaceae bacterium]